MNRRTLTFIGMTFALIGKPVFAGDFGWLTGDWCLSDRGREVRETWLAPQGDQLFGVNQTVHDGQVKAFEFLRIAGGEGQVRYLAQPGGREATAFDLADKGEGWVRFENPEHDFPQVIEYSRNGDLLTATISGPGEGGEVMKIPFQFQQCTN